MNNYKGWFFVVGLLIIISVGMITLVKTFENIANNTLGPVNNTTGAIATQVSRVLNPTPTILPDPVAIIHDVRSMARLETVQYSVERIITAETGQELFGALFGDKLLFVAHGVVIAGVDLEKISPHDIWVENSILYVHLPEPEIFVATLDNQKSYVYDRDTGILTKGDVNLETNARRVAEDSIKEAVLEDGILEQAGRNAELYFSLLLRDLGYPEVIFVGKN